MPSSLPPLPPPVGEPTAADEGYTPRDPGTTSIKEEPEPSPEDLAKQIECYAEKVGTRGCIADLMLFGDSDRKEISLVVEGVEKDSALAIVDLYDHIHSFVPSLIIEGAPKMDPHSPNTWILLCVNASYKLEGDRNHYMPGFFKEQLSDSQYAKLTTQAWQEEERQIEHAQKQLSVFKRDTRKGQSEDVLMHIAHLEQEVDKLLTQYWLDVAVI